MSTRALSTIAGLVLAAGCATTPPEAKLPAEIGIIHTATPAGAIVMATTKPVAVTAGQHKLTVISLPDGTERRAIDLGDRSGDALTIAPDGSSFAIGDHSGGITVWNTETGQVRFDFKLRRYPGLLVFSSDGTRLATAAQGDPVQVLDAMTGKLVATLGAPVGGTSALAFSRDDALIAAGDGDGAIRVYDAHTGTLISENRDLLMVPLAVAFTADGASVIAGSGDKVLTFIDARTGKSTRRWERTSQPVAAIEVSPDGKSVATVFMKAENMLEPDHSLIRELSSGAVQLDWLPRAMPIGGKWMSDGRLLVVLPGADGLHFWRLR